MTKKNILITGITGMDGPLLAQKFLIEGHNVYGLCRYSSRQDMGALSHPFHENLPWLYRAQEDGKLCVLDCDITDTSSIHKNLDFIQTFGPVDELYHMAAQSHVGYSHIAPVATMQANVIGTINILDAVTNSNPECKCYFAATSECFSGAPETVPQNELTPLAPQSPYAISKVAGVYYCRYLRSRGHKVSLAFCFNHDHQTRGINFVTRKITINLARIAKGQIKTFGLGNLEARRDWMYAKDAIDAMVLLNRHDTVNEVCLGSGVAFSVREFVEAGIKALDLPGQVEDYVYSDPRYIRPTEVHSLCADAQRARELLDWEPRIGFDELVERMCKSDIHLIEAGLI